MAKKIQGVYQIRNLVSGKFYIGSSSNIYKRWEVHKRRLRNGDHHSPKLQASWNKHGEELFKFDILVKCDSIEDMEAREQALIESHYNNPLCCNVSRWVKAPWRGATGNAHPNYGKPISDEQKAKLSAATKQQWETADPRTGKKHSQETKDKISAKIQQAMAEGRGPVKKRGEETRRRQSESLKGNQNAKGYKRTEAEREAIRERTLGNQHWLGKKHSKESIERMGTRAYAEDPKGNIQDYPSINAMREALGMAGLSGILRAIKSGYPLTSGSHAGWRFYTEKEDNRYPIPEEYKGVPRSRAEAKAAGASHYFNTVPCKNGHIALRKVKGTCTKCT